MKCMNNDVKSIVYRYLYDQVVNDILNSVDKYESVVYVKDIVKDGNRWIRCDELKVYNIHCQDKTFLCNVNKLTYYCRISIINGKIYMLDWKMTNANFKEFILIPINNTKYTSCWKEIQVFLEKQREFI